MIKKIGYYYPFTIPGTVCFGFLMYLIGAGYTQKNPYALFLSFVGLFVLALLTVLTRIQAYRLGKEQLIWDTSSALYAGRQGTVERFYSSGFTCWFFFRIHVRIRGRLRLGKGLEYRVLRESAYTGKGALEVPIWFQCSGTFSGEGVYSIKDIFGLVRARAGTPVSRTIPVQPSLLGDDSPVRIQISGGEDDTQPRKSSDQEKYYQREYVQGDRFRDINWKATSKIGEMFTRISPVTEKQTQLVLIDFRHFSTDLKYGPVHTAHLELLKRWCVSFLWKIKTGQPELKFIVYTGFGTLVVEELQDIPRLSVGLSGIFYDHDPKLIKDLAGIGEIYVFTTPFDRELGTSMQAYSGRRVTVCQTAAPPRKIPKQRVQQKTQEQNKDTDSDNGRPDIFTFSVMKNPGMIHIPGGWSLRRVSLKTRNGAGGQDKVRYAQAKLI